jgi:NhaA family Na+:H+ antiporter
LAGIGFTVSLLISDLAFEDGGLIDSAKIGVLSASLLAGILGFVLLWLLTRPGVAEQEPTKDAGQ